MLTPYYEFFENRQINGCEFMKPIHLLGHYQRETDWTTEEYDNVIGSSRNTFGYLYDNLPEGENEVKKFINLGDVVVAYEKVTDAFGASKIISSYIVDGQQRKRHYSLEITAINKLYPTIQLGDLIPVQYDSVAKKLRPVVSHPKTDEYMLKIWTESGLPPKITPANSNVAKLDKNYRHIFKAIQELGWSVEKMTAYIEHLKTKVCFPITEVLLSDAAKAFIDANTNKPNLKEHQLFKAGIAAHLVHDTVKAEKFCENYDEYIEILTKKYGASSGKKLDDHVTAMLRAIYTTDAGSTGKASLDSLTKPWSWVENNAEKLGLKTNEDWEKLAFNEIPHMFKNLFLILEAEEKYSQETQYIFQRTTLKGNYGHAIMLSHVVGGYDDSEELLKLKLNNTAKYTIRLADLYERSNKRRVDGKVRPKSAEMMNLLRGKTAEEGKANMVEFFSRTGEEFTADGHPISPMVRERNADFNKHTLRAVESVLSHLAGENRQQMIWDNSETKTTYKATIEHVIANTHDFDLINYRDLLCMQGLLPASENSSLQDKPIDEKLSAYHRDGGIWLKMLHPEFYNENGEVSKPQLRAAFKKYGIHSTPIPEEGLTSNNYIEERNINFNKLLEIYYSLDDLKTSVDDEDNTVEQKAKENKIRANLTSAKEFTIDMQLSTIHENRLEEEIYQV